MSELHVDRDGTGPEVLLVHGGASPSRTWAGLEGLADRWTLLRVYRRGFPPSPAGRPDFLADAADLAPLLISRPHLVTHSYGALGALLAVARSPGSARSLTMIEPPVFSLLPDDPEVAHVEALSDAVMREGLDADPAGLREFLGLAGVVGIGPGPLPEAVAAGVRRACGGRSPTEARIDLSPLREAKVPVLIASGEHSAPLERVCDALAAALDGDRSVAPGAGHFVAAAPGFAERLERFLAANRSPAGDRTSRYPN